jgi:drug/metabolite transporter (DMT)-like permease
MTFGFGFVLPICAIVGLPGGIDTASWVLLGIAAVANPVGLGIQYLAYRSGKVALVAAVVSTEGAVAALLAIATGETLGIVPLVGLSVVAAGVFVSALADDPDPVPQDNPWRAVGYALIVAGLFGSAVFSVGRVGADLSIALVLLPARCAGVLLIALPLAARRRLRLTRATVPYVIAVGLAEITGIACIAFGAGSSLAVTAVISSQWAAIAAIGAYFWFGQRLGRFQLAGIATIAIGVAVITSSA